MKLHLFCPSSSARQSEGLVIRPYSNDESNKNSSKNRKKTDAAINAGLTAWLKSQNNAKWTIRAVLIYVKRFGHILSTGDASVLMTLSPRNKHYAMAALANLAKFLGIYDQWLQIRRRYNLKWSSGSSSSQVLERFFNEGLTFDVMLSRVKRMIEALPAHLGQIVKFARLTEDYGDVVERLIKFYREHDGD